MHYILHKLAYTVFSIYFTCLYRSIISWSEVVPEVDPTVLASKKMADDLLRSDLTPDSTNHNLDTAAMSAAPWICRSCTRALRYNHPRQGLRFASNRMQWLPTVVLSYPF